MILCLYVAVFLAAATCHETEPPALELIDNFVTNALVTLGDCSNNEVLRSNIIYILFTQDNQQSGIELSDANFDLVNSENRVIFIIHGWLQSASEPWISQMKDAYLDQVAANVIIVDWSTDADALYSHAFCSVPGVGRLTGDLIYNLTISADVDLNSTQINGFSLGGQVAGYAGQQVQLLTQGSKIGRINGLDVAGVGYLGLPIEDRLDYSDAYFVQGIHTSNFQFGFTTPYATADFQVNYAAIPGCGAKQNGCPLFPGVPPEGGLADAIPVLFCHHIRSVAYFIESITSNNFRAVYCNSCIRFGTGLCNSETSTIMGENCPSTAVGVYYLNTASRSPFALG